MNNIETKRLEVTAKNIEHYFDRLWPICRSITGNGLRESFKILQEVIPLELTEVPTGSKVLDWEIPEEWNIEEAYIIDPQGNKIVDYKINNLHVVNYSSPVDLELELEELLPHLHSIKDQPTAIPYVTSYYRKTWGFCLSQIQKDELKPGKYKVLIKSSHTQGALTYGTCILPSTEGNKEEILISSYLCHPSLANNELSGPLTTVFIYQQLLKLETRKYNYRFVIAPETIGVIAFLHNFGDHLKENLHGGYVVTCCGDEHNITYKKSKNIESEIDRAAIHHLSHYSSKNSKNFIQHDFFPLGSDERQYCSPGYNFNVGSIMRSMYGHYSQYHTSLDNKDFVSFDAHLETVNLYTDVFKILEANKKYINTVGHGEPQLGKRDLYPSTGGQTRSHDPASFLRLMNYLLSFSDGTNDLIDIAQKANCSVLDFLPIIKRLKEESLLE